MSEAINQVQHEIIEEFSMLEGDMEMSNVYLIELGEKLPPIDLKYKVDKNLVKGCQSKVWLQPELKDNKVYFYADSNTAITKGLISLLIRILSGREADEIIDAELFFVDKIGLRRFVGTQRSNGLAAMIKQMKLYALALKNSIELKESE